MHLRPLLTALATVALAAAAHSGVMPGQRFTNLDGNVVTFHAELHVITNTTSCTVTDDLGTSGEAPGTPSRGGCQGETKDCGGMTTGMFPGETNRYRVHRDKLQQKKDDGSWKSLRKAPGPQPDPGGPDCYPQTGGGPWGLDTGTVGAFKGGDDIGTHPTRTH